MVNDKNRITVFEHQALKVGCHKDFKDHHLEALQRYFGEKGTNYFTLINNGVKFNQYVGVLQVGELIIEVLPKTDKTENVDWRNLLIGMLRTIGTVKVFSTGTANLRIKSNSILDLYFELFISEVEQLIHTGLIKQYRKYEENRASLKGKINFQKQIQQNVIHKERFFVNHHVYDQNNIYNQIIFVALKLVKKLNTSAVLQNRIGALFLAFPELSDISVNDTTFLKMNFNRKSEQYREALNIARLIILNYHPDLSKGQNNVLALLFDMNVLWERFVLSSLRQYAPENFKIKGKLRKPFWEPMGGYSAFIEPDIVIENNKLTYILDTKWKVLNDNRPSDDDLKQMYVYTKYYKSNYTALVYPYNGLNSCIGNFYPEEENGPNFSCSLIRLRLPTDIKNIRAWQQEICENLMASITEPKPV